MKRLEEGIYAFRYLLQNNIIYKLVDFVIVFTYLIPFNILDRKRN